MSQVLWVGPLSAIPTYEFIDEFTREGYLLTGNKVSVEFNGSKGYLGSISFDSEGKPSSKNRIMMLDKFLDDDGGLKDNQVTIHHDPELGISVDVQ